MHLIEEENSLQITQRMEIEDLKKQLMATQKYLGAARQLNSEKKDLKIEMAGSKQQIGKELNRTKQEIRRLRSILGLGQEENDGLALVNASSVVPSKKEEEFEDSDNDSGKEEEETTPKESLEEDFEDKEFRENVSKLEQTMKLARIKREDMQRFLEISSGFSQEIIIEEQRSFERFSFKLKNSRNDKVERVSELSTINAELKWRLQESRESMLRYRDKFRKKEAEVVNLGTSRAELSCVFEKMEKENNASRFSRVRQSKMMEGEVSYLSKGNKEKKEAIEKIQREIKEIKEKRKRKEAQAKKSKEIVTMIKAKPYKFTLSDSPPASPQS